MHVVLLQFSTDLVLMDVWVFCFYAIALSKGCTPKLFASYHFPVFHHKSSANPATIFYVKIQVRCAL